MKLPDATSHGSSDDPRWRFRLGAFLLIIGLGLSIFLFYTDAWFYNFYTTAPTVLLDLGGAFTLYRGIVSSQEGDSLESAGPPTEPSVARTKIVIIVLLPVWVWLLYSKISSTDFARLPGEAARADIFAKDTSCRESILRSLARQTPETDSVVSSSFQSSPAICTAESMRISGKTGRCMYLEGHNKRQLYCVAPAGEIYQLSRWDLARMRTGDVLVAQTAFGLPSAYFLPSKDLIRRIVYPRGRIIKMADHPGRKFEDHLIATFWLIAIYLALISMGAVLSILP